MVWQAVRRREASGVNIMATAKSNNPLAAIAYNVAKGVRKNSAIMRHKQVHDDILTGRRDESVYEHEVYLMDIDRANDWMVSQGVYKAGDIRASVPSMSMLQEKDAISSMRKWDESTGGIDVTTDTILWDGREYKILKVEAMNFWQNQPAKYRMTLRQGD